MHDAIWDRLVHDAIWDLLGLWGVGAFLGLIGKDWFEEDNMTIPFVILGQILRTACIYGFGAGFSAITSGILGLPAEFMMVVGFVIGCYYSVKYSGDADDLFNGRTIFGKKMW